MLSACVTTSLRHIASPLSWPQLPDSQRAFASTMPIRHSLSILQLRFGGTFSPSMHFWRTSPRTVLHHVSTTQRTRDPKVRRDLRFSSLGRSWGGDQKFCIPCCYLAKWGCL